MDETNDSEEVDDGGIEGGSRAYSAQEKEQSALRRQELVLKRREGAAIQAQTRPNSAYARGEGMKKVDQGSTTPELSNTDIGLLLCVALFFDVTEGVFGLIPIAGDLVGDILVEPVATLTLYWMYKRKGIEFKSIRRLGAFWLPIVAKAIPILKFFPDYALDVLLVTGSVKAEQKLNNI